MWENIYYDSDQEKYRKEHQFNCEMKTKQEEANIYSVIGICISVCLCMYLAFTIFPK